MTNEEKRKETEKSDANFEVLLKELKEMRTCQEMNVLNIHINTVSTAVYQLKRELMDKGIENESLINRNNQILRILTAEVPRFNLNPEETWQERLVKERNELSNKVDKLDKYITKHIDDKLDNYLFKQLYHMECYLKVLNLRIEKMKEEKATISRNNFKKVDNDHKSNDGEIVECFVIDGDSTPEDVAKAFGGKVCGIGHVGEKKWVEIPTKNGVLKACYGDLIVKSINGSLSIVKGVAI